MSSRMKLLVLVLVSLLGVLNACSSEGEPSASDRGTEAPGSPAPPASPAPEPSPSFGTGRALIQGSKGAVLVNIEVAETPEQQQLGLMHRTHLDEDAGMAFIFFEETSGGFWMKDTLIPLSIAFFDAEGTILRILDMEPCEEEPCEIYEPGVAYRGALEVNKGAFERWGVEEGDSLRLVHGERH
jgi:uncharacterized protein